MLQSVSASTICRRREIVRAIFCRFWTGLAIFLAYLVLFPIAGSAATPLETYIQTRNGFISQFAKAEPTNIEHDRALKALEEQLRSIIGPVDVAGFPRQGTINLQSLYPSEGGFDQVDGLRFSSERNMLFVTTDTLLKDFLNRNKTFPKDLRLLSERENFYSRVFDWDSAFMVFAEIPVHPVESISFARAFLILNGQDIGPFVPETVVVFAAKGDRIFLTESEVKISQVMSCKNEWGKSYKRASEALDRYHSSQLTDKKSFEDYVKLEGEAFRAYRSCFGRSFRERADFMQLTILVQSIIDRFPK